ncbi:hypothetical protein AGLY_002861 [Aphis glycines]|uniref:Uncharacterized protein n=1 Tax=Aphis glycines TaxID=307491 RepID=A0A6G0U2E3_APHGL|nr:hypothetical protein AGLY_002861 [Aphis glycines]
MDGSTLKRLTSEYRCDTGTLPSRRRIESTQTKKIITHFKAVRLELDSKICLNTEDVVELLIIKLLHKYKSKEDEIFHQFQYLINVYVYVSLKNLHKLANHLKHLLSFYVKQMFLVLLMNILHHDLLKLQQIVFLFPKIRALKNQIMTIILKHYFELECQIILNDDSPLIV